MTDAARTTLPDYYPEKCETLGDLYDTIKQYMEADPGARNLPIYAFVHNDSRIRVVKVKFSVWGENKGCSLEVERSR